MEPSPSGQPEQPFHLDVVVHGSKQRFLHGLRQWYLLGLLTTEQVQSITTAHQLNEDPAFWMPSQPTALDPEQAQDPPPVRPTTAPPNGYRVSVAYLLWILGLVGLCGLHRLYLGRVSGLLWLGTFGLASVGQLIDLFLIPGMVAAKNQELLLALAPEGQPVPDRDPSSTEDADLDENPFPVLSAAPENPGSTREPARLAQLLHNLKAELSVRWLLVLGLFLVVASSGLLAAGQWDRFSATGQYGLLLGYTVAFGVATAWAKRQEGLRLTGQTLQSIALLLVPINGWALDALRVPGPMVLLAVGILGAMTVWLGRSGIRRGILINFLVLAGLPLVWAWDPALVTYAGLVGTVLYAVFLTEARDGRADQVLLVEAGLLLVLRSVWAGDLPLSGLGLVLALLGWGWGEQQARDGMEDFPLANPALGNPSLYLVGAGWLVTLSWWPVLWWQVLVISFFGIRLLLLRLAAAPRPVELILLFGVGLETVWASWWVVPLELRDNLLTAVQSTLGWQGETLLGITLLPYGILWLAIAEGWRRDPEYPKLAPVAERLALGLGGSLLLLSLGDASVLVWHLALSTGILAVWLRYKSGVPDWQRVLTCGYGIGVGVAGILAWGPEPMVFSVWSGFVVVLVLVRAVIRTAVGAWGQALAVALDLWSGVLAVGLLGLVTHLLTWQTLVGFDALSSPPAEIWVAGSLISLALGIRLWVEGQSTVEMAFETDKTTRQDVLLYGLGWGLETVLISLVVLGWLGWGNGLEPAQLIGSINLGLGILAWLGGHQAERRWGSLAFSSLWVGPLIYGGLGWLWLHLSWTALSGVGTLGLAILLLGLGQRRQIKRMGSSVLGILGAIGLSLAAYESWLYFLSQLEGDDLGDGLVLVALLGVGLALVHRLCPPRLSAWMGMGSLVVRGLGHLNWGLAQAVLLLVWIGSFEVSASGSNLGAINLSATGSILWLLTALGGVAYGLWQSYGQDQKQDGWNYGAAVQIPVILWMCLNTWLSGWDALPWVGSLACGVGLLYFYVPWHRWGWRSEPGRHSALILPGAVILLTCWWVNNPSLLIGAGYYGILAAQTSRIRLSYISLMLSNWVLYSWMVSTGGFSFSLYVLPLAGSLIWVGHVDPGLQPTESRALRHGLRSLSVGCFCLATWVETWGQLWVGFWPMGLGLALVLAGLGLRIRAYLWVGSLLFGLTFLRQGLLLILVFPMLLWGVGILMGLGLIWVAASFERRRTQMGSWWSDGIQQLGFEQWE